MRLSPWLFAFILLVPTLFLTSSVRAQEGRSAYRLGPRDLVSVKVFEAPELNVERRISEDGMLPIPRVGDVRAQGLTDVELAARIREKLEATFLRRATVTVEVQEFRARPISVIGAVKSPGNLQVAGRMTLLEALTLAGGLTENQGGTIYVMRRASNGLSDQLAISVEGLLLKADPKLNIPIYSNDLINVASALPVTIYCLGEVAQPGALTFNSSERFTLLAAIARAGGLSERAARKVTIRRRQEGGSDEEIEVDIKDILAGKGRDVELVAGDVVVVKESFF